MSKEHSNRRVGAIGMCVTGAFALPLVLDPWVAAPVASQPAVPFSWTYALTGLGKGAWAGELNVHDDELAAAARRLETDDLTLLAFRFKADRICPSEKIERLRAACGARLESHEYETSWWRSIVRPPHAVLTEEYDKAEAAGPQHPTRQAFARLVSFLHAHL
jgi:dienelactone hydrolase